MKKIDCGYLRQNYLNIFFKLNISIFEFKYQTPH